MDLVKEQLACFNELLVVSTNSGLKEPKEFYLPFEAARVLSSVFRKSSSMTIPDLTAQSSMWLDKCAGIT